MKEADAEGESRKRLIAVLPALEWPVAELCQTCCSLCYIFN